MLGVRVLSLVVGAACFLGCSGKDSGGPGGPAGAISVALSGSTITVDQGASGTVMATITRTGGFSGAVSVAANGAPAGVSIANASFVNSGTTTTIATITVEVAATVPTGVYSLVILVSGAGVSSTTSPLTLTVRAAPNFSISVDPLVGANQNGSAAITVTLSRTNFTGEVTLTVSPAVAGVTAVFSPSPVAGNSATLTLNVHESVPVADYTVTIVGVGAPGSRSVTFTLAVLPDTRRSFSLVFDPSSVSLGQNATATAALSIVPAFGFNSAVRLSVNGLPAGMTATFAPETTTSSSILTITTNGAALGPSTLSIGAGTGSLGVNANYTVTVTPPVASTTLTFDFSACYIDDQTPWLAVQDGSGPWTRVTGNANQYTFTFTGSKAGVAYVTSSGLTVLRLATSEMAPWAARPCDPDVPDKLILGSAVNMPPNSEGYASLGGDDITFTSVDPTFTLEFVPPGTYDLWGYARSAAGVSPTDRGFVRRDINPPANSTMPAMDFTGSESFTPDSFEVIVQGAAGQSLQHGMIYLTGPACLQSVFYDQSPATGNVITAYGVPAALQRASENHGVVVRAFTPQGTGTRYREGVTIFHTLASVALAVPPSFAPTVTRLNGASHHRLRVQDNLPGGAATLGVVVTGRDSELEMAMIVSPSWLGTTILDVSVPDFSAVAGFDPNWTAGASEEVDYDIYALDFLADPASEIPSCSAGAYFSRAGVTGVLP